MLYRRIIRRVIQGLPLSAGLFFFHSELSAQSIGVNNTGAQPDSSAMLDVVASDKGILIPRTDTSALNASGVTLKEGLLIYQNSNDRFYFYDGAKWQGINGSSDDNQKLDVFNLSGTTLQLSLEDDGQATQTVDLSSLQDISLLQDANANTKIQTEESSDDDLIRFDLDGTEYFVMNSGRFEVKNTGNSVFMGESAGASDDLTDNRNVFIGTVSGKDNTSGNNNVGLGYFSLTNITGGTENVGIGSQAMEDLTTGIRNVAIGREAMANLVSSPNNVAMGYQAMRISTNGTENTMIGHEAGEFNDEDRNVFLGYRAGYNSGGSSNVFLGYRAGESEGDNNRLYIDNSSTSTPLIYGEFDNNFVQINGSQAVRGGDLSLYNSGDLNLYQGTGSGFKGSLLLGKNSDVTLYSTGGWLRLGTDGSSIAFFVDGNILNNNDPQMYLESSGELGIGTTSPSAELDVNGDVRIRGGSPADGYILTAIDANGNADWEAPPDVGYTQTTGTTTYNNADNFREVTGTVSVVVETGDLVKIEGQVVARLVSGSNDDAWGLKAVRTGSCGSSDENLIEFIPSEDNDDDHSNFRPYSYLDYYVATCSGTVSFSLYLRNTGDDAWQVQDRTLIVTVIRQ